MANRTSRPLNNFELVEHFLENVLGIDIEDDYEYEIISKIVSTELNIENFDESLISLNSKSYRYNKFRKDSNRNKLHRDIIAELLTLKRIDNDDDIKLGFGGAFPKGKAKTEFNAYIVTGLPASGKSGVSNKISDEFGAIILDSDFAKRKLPEYKALPFGATLVHEESDRIIFGENNPEKIKSLFDHCKELGLNIVLPKIGSNESNLVELIQLLKKGGYKVHLTLVELDRAKATQRALDRFKLTQRYVPLGLIFDTYSNNPTIAYYKTVDKSNKNSDLLESYGIINTDVPFGKGPMKTFSSSPLNPANLY